MQLTLMQDIAMASGMSAERMDQMLVALGSVNPFHPVVERLNSVEAWDGVDRFGLLTSKIESPHPRLVEKVLRAWMRQAIVAAHGSYGKVPPRDVLTLAGDQAIGKTSFLRKLAAAIGDNVFGEGQHLDPKNKDSVKLAVMYWMVELGELDGTFRKSDIAALKSFISLPVDTLRLPFMRKESTWQRRTVYAATVNDREFLVDQSGNKRWRVIEVERFDLDGIQAMVDDGTLLKIWKQMQAEVQAGAPWWLDAETEKKMEQHVDQYRRRSPVEQALMDMLLWETPVDKWVYMTATDIAERVGVKVNAAGHGGVAPALRSLLKGYTGQTKAESHRFSDVGPRYAWRIPPFDLRYLGV